MLASVFISHSRHDSSDAWALAEALGRRGIAAWFDKVALAGKDGRAMEPEMLEGVESCVRTVLLLSRHVLEDPRPEDEQWVPREVMHAIEKKGEDDVIVVCLEDQSRAFAELLEGFGPTKGWYNRRFVQVIDAGGEPRVHGWDGSGRQLDTVADAIAEDVLGVHGLGLASADVVSICVDQRGKAGERAGPCPNPDREPMACRDAPTLVFRPSAGTRTENETLAGEAWESWASLITHRVRSLARDRHPTVHLWGDAQLGVAFLVGRLTGRRNRVDLVAHGEDGVVFHYPQGRHERFRATGALPERVSGAEGSVDADVFLGNAGDQQCLEDFRSDTGTAGNALYAYDSGTFGQRGAREQVTEMLRITQLAAQRHARGRVRLFPGRAFGATALLGQVLKPQNVDLYEFRRDREGRADRPAQLYVHLPMPGGSQ